MKIKDHVSPKARRIKGILKGKYGLDLNDFKDALKGDRRKLKMIGEASRDARLTLELVPLLKEAYLEVIAGTGEYNKAVSEILVQGAKTAIDIDRSVMNATLQNQGYSHARKELATEFITAKNSERARHQYQMNYLQIKGYIDAFMAEVDTRAKFLQQTNRLEMKQLQAEDAYDLQVAKHLLQYGDDANVSLIPKKDYAPAGLSAALARVRTALGL